MPDVRKPLVLITLAFDPEEMARRGRIGADVTHSRHDARELTSPARAAFLTSFEKQVDPDGVLARRASAAGNACPQGPHGASGPFERIGAKGGS